jgi:hypothetical protein
VSTASYTTSASASPSTVAPGGSTSVTASVKSSTASTVLVDLEVYNSSGTKVFQQFWDNQSFSAGQTRTFSASWAVPTSTATGSYTIDVGIFSPGWGSLLSWNGAAGGLTVGTATAPTNTPTATPKPTNTPTPKPTNTPTTTTTQRSYTTHATISPSTVTRPGNATISGSVTSASAGSALVDVEVYNSAGSKVFQQFWDNQSFSAGQTRSYSATYAVPSNAATGGYTVTIGIFSTGWGTVYSWNSQAGTFTVQ